MRLRDMLWQLLITLETNPSDLSEKIGIPEKDFLDLMNGTLKLTDEMADLFAKSLGCTKEYWLGLEQ